MMCDVLPTISEDSISQRSSQFSGEDANFEQLMVSMLDERDKLMDSLREAQERLNEMESKLGDCEKERDSLHRQINANLPQVSERLAQYTHTQMCAFFFFFCFKHSYNYLHCQCVYDILDFFSLSCHFLHQLSVS